MKLTIRFVWNFQPSFRFVHLIAVLALCSARLFAQIATPGAPRSFVQSIPGQVPVITLLEVDRETLLREDETLPLWERNRFAIQHDVSLSLDNSGIWTELPEGRLWRLRIRSPHAYSLGLIYGRWQIPEGATLFLYNDDRSQVLGAFTSFNNWKDGTNTTAPMAGDAVTLEYYEPASVSGSGVLSISKVCHAYRNLFGRKRLDEFGDAGDCNINVNCPEGATWQSEKRGVAMMISDGTRWCSGSLINTARNDYTPYYLTANHCIQDIGQLLFMFNYESPTCSLNQDGPLTQTVANAVVVANNRLSDFALLLISSPIPAAYNPYFNGWNRVDTAWTGSVDISHPSGDVKKIAIDSQFVGSSSWVGSPPNSHWEAYWDRGMVEPGSSGSPLFDVHHRIAGQLEGGNCSCEDPDGHALFGKLSMSWDLGTLPETRLRDWLDPDQTNSPVVNGIDPQQVAGWIGGTVRDNMNMPLQTVRVRTLNGHQEVYSDLSGRFVMPLSQGVYTLEFSHYGYTAVTINNVAVVVGDTVNVHAQITPQSMGVVSGFVLTQWGLGIEDAQVSFPDIPVPGVRTDREGRFSVPLFPGMHRIFADFFVNLSDGPFSMHESINVHITADDTAEISIAMTMPNTDPTPPDAYGYRAYDRYDRDLPAPVEWVEINPDSGGFPGTEFAYLHHDSAHYFATPFPLSFYGADYDSLTVNCNGWMLPGIHHEPGADHLPIPFHADDGPPGIVAALWSDFAIGDQARQFAWHDMNGGRWIFEMTRQRLARPIEDEFDWQVHWLDPAFYPTVTGDAQIIFVYRSISPLSCHTTGIEHPNGLTGIQIEHDGFLGETSLPLEDGALRFTTAIPTESGSVNGRVTLYPPSAEIQSATIRLAGQTFSLNAAGEFSGASVPACPASAVLMLNGYEASRAVRVPITPNETAFIALQSWRLDPPRDLAGESLNQQVTLHWRRPESVEYCPTAVQYEIWRSGVLVQYDVSDTLFTDSQPPSGQELVYSVAARYRFGKSQPSDSIYITVDVTDANAVKGYPSDFTLSQNFPNPFNSSTTIRYGLPYESRVSLRVFNISGQEVAILVDNRKPAGIHYIRWQPDGQPSGVYFLKLESATGNVVKKMLLMK